MLKNTIQHYLYLKQEITNEYIKLFRLLNICVWIVVPFAVVEAIRKAINPLSEFFLSFMFWTIVILLIIYWMPNKKEYREWIKKNHSTF